MRKYTDTVRVLTYFHDFLRVLYFLKDGITTYRASKIMVVDQLTAKLRLEGWVKHGVLVKERDGRRVIYRLAGNCIEIEGFGRIVVSDRSVNVYIDPLSNFTYKQYDSDSVRVVVRDCNGAGG